MSRLNSPCLKSRHLQQEAVARSCEEPETRAASPSSMRGYASPKKGLEDEAQQASDQLSAWDAPTRRFGLQTLGLLGPAAVDQLPEMLRLLEDEDPEVRKAAAAAVGRVGGGARELAGALKDPEASVRSEAALALGRLGAQAPRSPRLRRRLLAADVEAQVPPAYENWPCHWALDSVLGCQKPPFHSGAPGLLAAGQLRSLLLGRGRGLLG